MDALMNALEFRIYGAEVKDWVIAAIAALVMAVALRLMQAYAVRKLRSRVTPAEHSPIAFAVDLVRRTAWPVLAAIALNVGALVGDLARPLRQARGVVADLRGGLRRAERRRERVHGRPAGDQPRPARALPA